MKLTHHIFQTFLVSALIAFASVRAAAVDTPPVAIDQDLPAFPPLMRDAQAGGDVKLRFQIDTQGHVHNPVVVESSSPGFNENAILAVMKWKFKPALKDGIPERAMVEINVHFAFPGVVDEGNAAYATRAAGAWSTQDGDVPVHVRGVQEPVYPYELLRAGTTGSANERMIVDDEGRVLHVDIISATTPAFGLALEAALEGFAFDPAKHEGRTVPARVTYTHDFRDSGFDNAEYTDALDLEKEGGTAICNPGNLDAPLQPISRTGPIFPLNLRDTGVTGGTAVVEFLVNKKGHVCLPRIVAASAPEFGYAAVQAVSVWLFEPPIAGGHAAVVRVRVPFKFKAPRPRNS